MAFTPQQLQAAQAYLAAKPEAMATFERDYAGDIERWLTSHVEWWRENGGGVQDLAPYAAELKLLNDLGITPQLGEGQTAPAGIQATTTTAVPAEQGLYNQVIPGLTAQIAGDAGRQADVTDLTNQTNAAFGTLRDTLGAAKATFDGSAYLRANPDVAAAFAANPEGLTPDQYALRHYEQFGRNEGRDPAYTSGALAHNIATANTAAGAQTAAATTAAQAQLAALNQSLAAMGTNLQGALGAQAAALAAQVASLQQNLTTLDATQRKALADQIAAQQANLEQSIAAQRAALEQQVRDLQGNATTAANSRRAALEQQIAELTAAQAPVAEARIRGAEALTTAINIGLEETTDQLRADAAREGFVGGSTMQDTALARAAIGARQEAARAGADARLLNAGDTRDIARTGAGGRFSIADALAGQTQQAADFGATGRAGLSTNLATGTQAIGDAAATQGRALTDTTATSRAGIGAYGANTTYNNANAGIGANLDLQNTGAQQQYSIAAALAQQNQDIANRNAAAQAGARDQLFPNAINAAQVLTTVPAQNAAANTALIPYGTAGTRDALSTLNWWSSNATPPPPTAVTTPPSTTGNGISTLGAGLLGSAFQIGQGNNWWRATPAPTTPPATNTNATSRSGQTGLSWGSWGRAA